jgi:thiol:disulfide interchange protein DsbC
VKKLLIVPGLILAALAASLSQAQLAVMDKTLREKLVLAIEVASQNQLQILDIKATPLPNMFEVELNTGEILYTDISGDFLFAGDMYQTSTEGLLNLSATKRQSRTIEKVQAVPDDQKLIFTPDEVKASITVFTDVDCTYCRALHRDLEELLALGIEVRYMAYPRGGEQAGSYDKMISVWCSDDRHKSLTQAKNGQNIPSKDCNSPVLEHYALGNELGITGTPALIFPDGRLVPGYVEPDRLAALLQID